MSDLRDNDLSLFLITNPSCTLIDRLSIYLCVDIYETVWLCTIVLNLDWCVPPNHPCHCQLCRVTEMVTHPSTAT
jgi:hypothetical protein